MDSGRRLVLAMAAIEDFACDGNKIAAENA
jgi:hypothetical protein